tara:strand:- start:3780 stop:4367 length:588 start_codon:yes stop_codon:yes gene_type:complete
MNILKAKIYKIVDNAYTKMYIGSTTQTLSRRFSNHKSNYKLWREDKYHYITSYDLFEEFGIENCKIELIENFECNSNDELHKKEGEYIQNNVCVNKLVAGRKQKDRYKNDKAFRDKEKARVKNRYDTNIEYKLSVKNTALEYQKQNKDNYTSYQKKYQEKNYIKVKKANKLYELILKDDNIIQLLKNNNINIEEL